MITPTLDVTRGGCVGEGGRVVWELSVSFSHLKNDVLFICLAICTSCTHLCICMELEETVSWTSITLHLRQGLIPEPGAHIFSAMLESRKPWQSPCLLHPQNWGDRCLWRCLAYCMGSGIQTLVFMVLSAFLQLHSHILGNFVPGWYILMPATEERMVAILVRGVASEGLSQAWDWCSPGLPLTWKFLHLHLQ